MYENLLTLVSMLNFLERSHINRMDSDRGPFYGNEWNPSFQPDCNDCVKALVPSLLPGN